MVRERNTRVTSAGRIDFKTSLGMLQRVFKWMATDLERCLDMEPGPNFVVAMVLSEYTEIMGGFATGKLCDVGKSAENYRRFLEYLGCYYEQLDSQLDLYATVRCGLAHEYFVKGPSTIVWRKSRALEKGVYLNGNRIVFNCEAYYKDWKDAVSKYMRDMETDQNLQKNLVKVVDALITRPTSRPLYRISPES